MANSRLSILAVPAFDDNYLWLVHDGHYAMAVDPGDGAAVQAALERHQLQLSAILLTHHHADHTGGVAELLSRHPVPAYGPAQEAIAGVSQPLIDGDVVSLSLPELQLQVLAVPGHTAGHLAYYSADQQALFCGDTLFAGGCGRLFEGSPAQMLHSLERLASLPDSTRVFCAHEYTISNLRFALAVEPDNPQLIKRFSEEQDKRQAGLPTVPSLIGLEKSTNPFLRIDQPAVIASLLAQHRIAAVSDPVTHFAALREWKNQFR